MDSTLISGLGIGGIGVGVGFVTYYGMVRFAKPFWTPRNVILITSGMSGVMVISSVAEAFANKYGVVSEDISGTYGIGLVIGIFISYVENRRQGRR